MSFGTGFITGASQSIRITAETGSPLEGQQITLDGRRRMMEYQYDDTLLKSDTIDDPIPDHQVIPDGGSGSIEVEKQSANFHTLIKLLNAAYNAGNIDQQRFTIEETVLLPKGQGTESNTLMGVVFHGYKPGTYQKKNITLARVQFAFGQAV